MLSRLAGHCSELNTRPNELHGGVFLACVAQRPWQRTGSKRAFNVHGAAMLQCALVTCGGVTKACHKHAIVDLFSNAMS
jgi:hypothetical protein